MEKPDNTSTSACAICSQLKDEETSFYKYAAPDYDQPLPPAAAQLLILRTLDATDVDKRHVRCCPLCGTLYDYLMSYEYSINGSEDEEELTRMTLQQAANFYQAQVQLLEALRREIDELQSAAGSLGDYIDRGRPSPQEEHEAHESMLRYRQEAEQLSKKLQTQVEILRKDCPKILTTWAEAHRRTCRYFLSSFRLKREEDTQVMRYVAQTTLEAWELLPYKGETFISINMSWLENYLEHFDNA